MADLVFEERIKTGYRLLAKKIGANLNSTADQSMTVTNATKYVIEKIIVTNSSANLGASIAAGGIYDAASKGGTAIVAAAQLYTALTASGKNVSLTLEALTSVLTAATLYISLTVANGSAATADFYVFGYVMA